MGSKASNSKTQDPQKQSLPDPDSKFQNLIVEYSEPKSSNTSRTQKIGGQNSSPQRKMKALVELSEHSSSSKKGSVIPHNRPKSLLTTEELSIRNTRIEKLNSMLNDEIKNYGLEKEKRCEKRATDLAECPKKKKKRKKAQPESVMMGIWIGVTVSIIIVLIVIVEIGKLSITNESQFSRDFPTWRGIAIWIFYVWILGFDIYMFEKFKIRYREILKIAPNHYPDAVNIFRIAGFQSSIFVIMFLFYVMDIAKIYHVPGFAQEYYSLVSWGLFVGFLFLPVPFFSHKGRFFVFSLFIDSLLSPFRGVTFPVTWMTDQAVSMAVPLKDLEYTICYYTELDFKSNYNVCLDANRISTVLIVAVSVCSIRMVQCMRQGYDKGEFFMTPFFFNTLKYAATLCTAVLAFEYKLGADQIQAAWLLFAFISSVYSFAWDLKMDWDLLQRNRFHPFLREKLVFGKPRVYYCIMVGNLLMRLVWIITISPKLAAFLGNSNLVFLVTGMIEIFRRGVWNLIRVEKEHLALVSKPPKVNLLELKAQELQRKLSTVEKSLNLQIKMLKFFKKIEQNRENITSELQRIKSGESPKDDTGVESYNRELQEEDMQEISQLMEQILKSDSFLKRKLEETNSVTSKDKQIYRERLLSDDENESKKKQLINELEVEEEKYKEVERIKAELKNIESQEE